MMAGHGGGDSAVGGPARHIPVLLAEVLAALAAGRRARPSSTAPSAPAATRGRSSPPARRVIAHRPRSRRDRRRPRAGGRQRRPAARWCTAPFSQLDEHAPDAVDGVVLDIGVSSMQIDEAERGFSFRFDGPLDMRMAQAGPSAADVVNRFKAGDLARIFGLLGEEKQAGRIARDDREAPRDAALRAHAAISPTPSRRMSAASPSDKIHPATRVFQALRIFVNDELGELAEALFAAERVLKPGGRLVVVTFHSLEDRIVKRFIADRSAQPGRLAPPARRRRPRRRPSRSAAAPMLRRRTRKPRSIRARVRPSCARPFAPTHRRARPIFPSSAFPSFPKSGYRLRGSIQCFVPATSC